MAFSRHLRIDGLLFIPVMFLKHGMKVVLKVVNFDGILNNLLFNWQMPCSSSIDFI